MTRADGRAGDDLDWPPACTCSVALGNSRLMILALASAMMGSSVPAMISVAAG